MFMHVHKFETCGYESNSIEGLLPFTCTCSYMSIIILKFKYLKHDVCTTRKIQIQNIIKTDHVNFGILLTKGEQFRDKINFAFFFLSAAADLVSHAKSCYL